MAAIKQYPLQLHEEIITLCCVEPKSSRHFFETECSSSTPSFTCPWTLRLIKEKAGKVGHRAAAIFHLSSGAADQRVNAKVLKLPLERIFDDSLFCKAGLCACVLVSRKYNGNNRSQSDLPLWEEMAAYCSNCSMQFHGGWGVRWRSVIVLIKGRPFASME